MYISPQMETEETHVIINNTLIVHQIAIAGVTVVAVVVESCGTS